MKNYIYILIIIVFSVSCYDLNTTQNDPPSLKLDSASLLANGQSQTIVTATTKHSLGSTQEIVFTTSNGLLFNYPADSGSGSKTKKLFPNSSQAMVILQSANKPDNDVLVTASINDMVASKTLKFKISCPQTVNATINKNSLSISNNDVGQLTYTFLRDDLSMTSEGIRIDLKSANDSIATIPLTIYTDTKGTASAAIAPLDTGKIVLSANIIGCDNKKVLFNPTSINIKIKK